MALPRNLCVFCARSTRQSRLFSTNIRRRANVQGEDHARTLDTARGTPSPSSESAGPLKVLSTAAAQPFSTPKEDAAATHNLSPMPTSQPPKRPKSSVEAGTVLVGLELFKGKDPPVALEDHEYPDWLWGLLDLPKKTMADVEVAEGFKTRKERIRAKKQARKDAKAGIVVVKEKKIPLDLQTVDLPIGDGSLEEIDVGLKARAQLTDAMRLRRKKAIKEANYLTGV